MEEKEEKEKLKELKKKLLCHFRIKIYEEKVESAIFADSALVHFLPRPFSRVRPSTRPHSAVLRFPAEVLFSGTHK